MPYESVVALLALMVFTTLCGTLAWGSGVRFLHHVRGPIETHPAMFLVVYLVLCGFILGQKAAGWQVLLLLSVIQLGHEIFDAIFSQSSYPFLQWLFVGGAVATAIYCFRNRIHFD